VNTSRSTTRQVEDQPIEMVQIFPLGLGKDTWLRVEREIKLLFQKPSLFHLSRRSVPRLYNKKWINADIPLNSATLRLLDKLMATFVATRHYAIVCARFDFHGKEGINRLGVSTSIPLMTFWARRQFPWLCRVLFSSQLKRHFSIFRDVPLSKFYSYTPRFVLYRLRDVLELPGTAKWVFWIISGKNLRHAPHLPISLTRMMAHWVIQAPFYLTFNEALFYGQVRGLGGSEELYARLRSCFWQYFRVCNNFNEQVVNFLVRYEASLDLSGLPRLLGYIHHRYFDEEEERIHLASCSLSNLYQQMDEWYALVNIYYKSRYRRLSWPKSNHQAFTYKKEQDEFSITELLNYEDLCHEGKVLNHCVATYVEDCLDGSCSIWSLRCDGGEEPRSLVTIEVDREGNIAQALGKYNAQPEEEQMDIIKAWARKEGLRIRLS